MAWQGDERLVNGGSGNEGGEDGVQAKGHARGEVEARAGATVLIEDTPTTNNTNTTTITTTAAAAAAAPAATTNYSRLQL